MCSIQHQEQSSEICPSSSLCHGGRQRAQGGVNPWEICVGKPRAVLKGAAEPGSQDKPGITSFELCRSLKVTNSKVSCSGGHDEPSRKERFRSKGTEKNFLSFLFICLFFFFQGKFYACSGFLVKGKTGGSRTHLHYLMRQSTLSPNYKFHLYQLLLVTLQEYFVSEALESNHL